MSAVNNTLREIILRERPLTVTNNGSSLFSSTSPRSFLHRRAPRRSARAFSPFCCPLCVAYIPDPSTPFTPQFCEAFTFPMHFSATLYVHVLEVRKRSWSIPAFESMDVPEKKNQAVVMRITLRLNGYACLSRNVS